MRMENRETDKKARVLYAFIDKETTGKYEKYPRAAEPTLMLKHGAIKIMLDYALKKYFGLDSNGAAIGRLNNGGGFYDGVYFSTSTCSRAVCVAVSADRIGVDIVIPYRIDETENVKQFDDTARKEYETRMYGDDTFYYIQSKLQALKKKHNLLFDRTVKLGDFEQRDCAFHRDEFLNKPYIFAATGEAEFIKQDIKTFLP